MYEDIHELNGVSNCVPICMQMYSLKCFFSNKGEIIAPNVSPDPFCTQHHLMYCVLFCLLPLLLHCHVSCLDLYLY